ncbi:AMP-binding protein [Streptomyces sp. NPDC091259]|uniref:AMP-binding protein n=1 Tax=Streptomyces sp. NPDC091259 TaxID=3365976 RepID=UPI0038285826
MARGDFTFAGGGPGIVGTLSVGGTVVLVDDPGPTVCAAVIDRERVTVTSVPSAVARLWPAAPPTARSESSSLRLVQVVGAPVDRATAERPGAVASSGSSAWPRGCSP